MTTVDVTKRHLLDQLRPFGQEHLLAFWDELPADGQTRLAAQIEQIDFAEIQRLARSDAVKEDVRALMARADGPPSLRAGGDDAPYSPADCQQRGARALRDGLVGVILVAGGQGTRLGFNQPKGMYSIGPVSGASLFQILLEGVVAAARRYQSSIPLYLMTSPATHQQTRDYLAEHDRFGVPEADLQLFCQGVMPAVDRRSGRVLLSGRDQIALSPDGHGGMLAALDAAGLLGDMRRRGIEYLFYMQVDNPLTPVCDPAFLGTHILAQAEVSTLAVAKQSPHDKLGNVVAVDGRLRIVEYSDFNHLPDQWTARRREDGGLVFWAGNTAIHAFNVSFLRRIAETAGGTPFHIAEKAVPHLDASGQRLEPDSPNAIKFERFIFDLLPEARRAIAVEGDGADVFAPLKNAVGSAKDSPEHVQQQMITLHRGWLRESGATVAEGARVEISPLFALDAEEVRARIEPGLKVRGTRFFGEAELTPAADDEKSQL